LNPLGAVLATLAAYLIGSLSFAVIVSRAMGLADPRSYGSGNPGATNVLRSGSKAAAIVTLLLDAAKGWLPVMLVKWFGPTMAWAKARRRWWAGGFPGAPVAGVLPLQGRQGRGHRRRRAAGLRALAGRGRAGHVADHRHLLRYSSLASIVAAVFAPAYYLLGNGVGWTASGAKALAMGAMGLLLIYRHRENIRRLLAGTESRLGSKKS
jgi:glycerol-3-phosphate acyltransferase PlsY